ncbi:MAG: cell surface protein SprA [Flavobacteriales bacterium]|nr:cell surface protein SprA [Flavobacteriales bacterium]
MEEGDTLAFPFNDNGNQPLNSSGTGGLFLSEPSNIKTNVVYNSETGKYEIIKTIGDTLPYQPPTEIGLDEYLDYSMDKSKGDYWKLKSAEQRRGVQIDYRPELEIKSEAIDKIFGGSTVDIKPTGSAELRFGGKVQHTENPQITPRNQTVGTFEFNMKIQLNVVGTVGDKMKLSTNYNTESTFEFENQMKLEYSGYEDEIIKKIEAGNVSLPLTGSLNTGSQTLFGLKTQLQFGRLMVASVLSQQKGEKSEINVQGGAQIQEFEVKADQYEQNKHFFLSHYFRDNYEHAASAPPIIKSLINITRVEVWVTNTNNTTENTRNIIAFQDVGEGNSANVYNAFMAASTGQSLLPSNHANSLYNTVGGADENGIVWAGADSQVRGFTYASSALGGLNMRDKKDYQKVELARRLTENEYYIHPQLGYISMRQELNLNQMLAVAFQYTYQGKTYQVGEFSDDLQGQDALFLKLLKSTERNTHIPMWDLMMKNIYAIGAYNVQKDGFELEIWYLNINTGVENNFLPEGPEGTKNKQLLGLLGLDELTVTNLKGKDGVFDYIQSPRMTIVPQNGRIIFPVLEPFGSHIHTLFDDDKLASKYAFDSLYTNTQTNAKVKYPEKNRYVIRGETKSSSGSEISLGKINIPEGSVVVTSGGVPLVENTDYLVDYNLGRVTIINQSILESGTPIKVSLESQQLFNMQQKTLFASRFDYTVSDDLILGGTIMNLSEKPITQKVNQGSEPMSNTIIGLDGNYKTESQFLTSMVDKIPLINTKEKSNIIVGGEVAKLFPGTARAIQDENNDATAYIDDFEGSQTAIDIKSGSSYSWILASTPQGQPDLFPEGNLVGDLAYGFNRAKLAWYTIDPLFFPTRNDPNIPDNVDADIAITSNHFMREVQQREVFPNKDPIVGSFNNIATLDLAFYPKERGPYNYDVDGLSDENGDQYGYGINPNGNLKNPEQRWGGIMRELNTNDFEAANVEYIQFWLMDPFAESADSAFPQDDLSGKLYFNIGQISEDILRDGRKTFEQGMPIDETSSQDFSNPDNFSTWGRLPSSGTQAIVNAFENDPTARPYQDVGFDGLRDEEERIFFEDTYLKKIAEDSNLGTLSTAYTEANADPSADDYNYFRDDDYDNAGLNILQRYKKYNGLEGNSPTSQQYSSENAKGYPTTSSQRPHVEDINNDNTLDETESYYQWSIDISKTALSTVGENYVSTILTVTTPTSDGDRPITWYQFKIPIAEFEKAVGGISDFRSMRFIRMYMRGFEQPVYLRFAQLQLTRGQWRKYTETVYSGGEELNEETAQDFNIGALNIIENSEKEPVNYILPPGISRQQVIGSQTPIRQNEQSMTLEVCNLEDGSGYAAYKNIEMDMRRYKRLKMYVHAEAFQDAILDDDDLRLFVRLGTDFDQNYYEYEIPLAVTTPGRYDGTKESQQEIVWPESNNIDINFEDLWGLKLIRNQAILDGKHANAQIVYDSTLSSGANIYVSGNPNLADVKTIMIGVRNPRKKGNPDDDDGFSKCATIWVNELRLTEFDNNGGWAAIGRVSANFADLANVSASGSIRTKGFGTVEQKVNERQKETIKTMDVSSTIQLGKFIPEKIGIRLPMYVGLSVIESTPEFSPLAEDVPTAQYENALVSNLPVSEALAAKQELKKMTRDITTRKSLNFTNIRKEKAKGSDRKTKFYDVSNWTGTYAYTEENHHNFELENDLIKNYRGGLNYNFNASPKNIKPFDKIKFLRKSKYLRLVKDFNFYPGPKQIGFRTDVNRLYNERQIRNVNDNKAIIDPLYNKNFNWSRNYNLKWDLSKALKLDFTAGANALIEENAQNIGKIDRNSDNELISQDYALFKDSVMASVKRGGEVLNYRHNTNINYTIPFSKFPLTNWINSTARYSSSYVWDRAPFAAQSFGNTIQNSQTYNLNATFNMITLYNKVGYLKKVNNKFRKSSRSSSRSKKNVKDGKGADDDKKKKDKNKKNQKTPVDYLVRTLMSVRNVNGTYSRSRGTLLPGYNQETTLLGMDDFGAPGYGFIFGQQDDWGDSDTNHFANWAMLNNWLVPNDSINTQFSRTFSENMNFRASVEPIKDLRIGLTAIMTTSLNKSEYYRYQGDTGQYAGQWLTESPTEYGNYSSSIITIQTAFVDGFGSSDSKVFDAFLANRVTISQRLSEEDGISVNDGITHANDTTGQGYMKGYGATSKEVLVPAFLAAYTGTSAKDVSLDPTTVGYKNSKYLPIPNWNIRYNGLSKIPALKKYVRKISLNHKYQSTYSLSSYSTNLDFDRSRDRQDVEQMLDQSSNYESELVLNTITISEKFSPLINIDMTFQNSFLAKLEIRKDRTLSLNIANTQVTEIKGMEYVLGMGYEIKSVKLPFQLREGVDVISPLKIRADLSYRRNETIIRKIIEETHQTTSGQDIVSIKVTADYNLSKALRLRGFADYGMTIPKISTTFKRWTLNAGVSILFTLSG